MKIVYSWLKDFVDIDVPAEELADALTGAGLEVASIEHYKIPAGVKVARIVEREKHPNADKLSVCKVDAGGHELLTIVCGAPNAQAGMIVALATEGTVLAPDFIIKKASLRGVQSSGMLCSERELGLSNDHSGIMSLPGEFKTGEELSTYYPEDAVIEIEITPDRGDCLSVLGVAREVSARYGVPIKETARRPVEESSETVSQKIAVQIDAPQACPRYSGRLVKNVTLKPSPFWMQHRLSLAGIRPINNVVDITNYCMLHFGQPMHAFDYDRIEGHKIIVKTAGKDTSFKTLDDTERKLVSSDLLICDDNRPVALAGIMGGAGSEITESTVNVFLECAYFDPVTIRKTSKRIGLSTDSSYRFERGVDPDKSLIDALDTAAELVRDLAGGIVCKGLIDENPGSLKPRTISIRPSRASRVLGIEFTVDQVVSSLSSLGLQCVKESPDLIRCTAPLFRHDLTIEEDLIEEVGRLYGYDNIPTSDKAPVSLYNPISTVERITDRLRSALAFFGLNEIVTNSMTSEKRRQILTPEKKPVSLLNPLNPDMAQLRTTMAGSMLEALVYNLNHKNVNNHLFEIGKVYEVTGPDQVSERDVVGIIIEGNFWGNSWNTAALPCDFYVLKGILDAFAAHIGTGNFNYKLTSDQNSIIENEVSNVSCGNLIKGYAGKVSKKTCDYFDIKSSVYYAELDITSLLQSSLPQPVYKPLPKFPALERDFCFVMSEELNASTISDEIFGISPLVEDVKPFDLYRGEKLGPGRKSIAFSVKLRSADRTLTDKEAEGICSAIVTAMQSKYGVLLRT
jgi:phenylalanyl-tRNA synthetase beta chain